eukprot:scaffold159327_cov42-Tisochrysis_lutea.AAC.2
MATNLPLSPPRKDGVGKALPYPWPAPGGLFGAHRSSRGVAAMGSKAERKAGEGRGAKVS